MSLPHLAARVLNTPLLIEPGKAETILSVLMPKLRGEPIVAAASPAPAPAMRNTGRIAVLPIYGTLVRRAGAMDAESGLVSYDQIRSMLRAAVADGSVGGILLDFDSCGGEAAGCADLADEIAAARETKPVYAVADDACYSAAYWLASAAERIFVTQTGGVGSIGVLALHVDQSTADAQYGLKYSYVAAGARKLDLNPHAPLSENGAAFLRQSVDQMYGLFTASVAKRRGMTAEAVKATEAGIFEAGAGKKAGLADEIGTMDDALVALAKRMSGGRSGSNRASTEPVNREGEASPASTAAEGEPQQSLNPESHMSEKKEPAGENAAAVNASAKEPAAPAVDVEKIKADAKAEASRELAAYTREIGELCALAGMPGKALDFIAKGTAVADVRTALVAAQASKAGAEEIVGTNGGASGADAAAKANNHGWDGAFAKATAHRARARAGNRAAR